MDVAAYLRRIGVKEFPPSNLAGLRTLHRAHLLAIPFENLDVQLGRRITTDIAPIYEKIVERRRGGWCYEMNGLFGWALRELGFAVTRMAGGVMRETMADFMVGNHLVLKVELPEGPYVADVGFGDGPIEPFPITVHAFNDGRFPFALSHPEPEWWRFHNHPHGGAKSFDFRLHAAEESLLAERCAFLQSAETSPFVQNLVCQRYTPEGLVILRGRVLRRITGAGVGAEESLESGPELISTLREMFDLDVPEALGLWPKIAARHAALFGNSAS
jgi:N-hydroxyarylamine O-acetyltransferase